MSPTPSTTGAPKQEDYRIRATPIVGMIRLQEWRGQVRASCLAQHLAHPGTYPPAEERMAYPVPQTQQSAEHFMLPSGPSIANPRHRPTRP